MEEPKKTLKNYTSKNVNKTTRKAIFSSVSKNGEQYSQP